MTAPALPEDVERALFEFRTCVEVYGAEDGGFRRIDPREAALRAAIAAHIAPPVAPSFDATLDDLAVDVDYSPDRGTTTTIVGLDDVRAAHRAEVERAVAEERARCMADCDTVKARIPADAHDETAYAFRGGADACRAAIRERGAKP